MADRRRQRASQDTEDEESGASGSDSGGSPPRGGGSCSGSAGGGGSGSLPSQRGGRGGALHLRRVESGGAKSAEESECESEDGIEGDAVLSDYESAEDSESEEGNIDAIETPGQQGISEKVSQGTGGGEVFRLGNWKKGCDRNTHLPPHTSGFRGNRFFLLLHNAPCTLITPYTLGE